MGALTHNRPGNVVKEVAPGLAIGSAIGAYFGATFAYLIPEFYLKLVFAIVSIWMGIRYIRA